MKKAENEEIKDEIQEKEETKKITSKTAKKETTKDTNIKEEKKDESTDKKVNEIIEILLLTEAGRQGFSVCMSIIRCQQDTDVRSFC